MVQSRDRGQEVSFFGRKARSRSLVGGKFSPVAVSYGFRGAPYRRGGENRVSESYPGGRPYRESRLGVKWNKFTRNGG